MNAKIDIVQTQSGNNILCIHPDSESSEIELRQFESIYKDARFYDAILIVGYDPELAAMIKFKNWLNKMEEL